MIKKLLHFSFIFIIILAGCKTLPVKESFLKEDSTVQNSSSEKNLKKISMIFAGDIMAHSENYSMKNYSLIWNDVLDITKSADLRFANLESPVDNLKSFSSYPSFNMNSSYADQTIKAGFNVFSLVNNHTNDQGLEGIQETIKWAEKTEKESEKSSRIYFSGLHDKNEKKLTYCLINHKDFKIIFCAITEIVNRNNCTEWMNYVNDKNESNKEKFINQLKEIREQNPCDLFILSIHSNEPEYKFDVQESRKKYYYRILDAGIDVIWANHPHVIRERELIGSERDGQIKKLILYGNGNTISGQRRNPQFDRPENPRDNTGDGLMFFVQFAKNEKNGDIFISEKQPFYITTYIAKNRDFLIKKLDDNFITWLENDNQKVWAKYIKQRKIISEKTKETIIWR